MPQLVGDREALAKRRVAGAHQDAELVANVLNTTRFLEC